MTRPTKKPRNVVGPQIRVLRSRRGWSQPVLAAKCQLVGWDVSRDIIARIELRVRWVADFELMLLAQVLGVPVGSLLPRQVRWDEILPAQAE
ncbi:MAG: helix-turn-helix domain-containing protein [Opitutaceae bacterium]